MPKKKRKRKEQTNIEKQCLYYPSAESKFTALNVHRQ
jgi:hypothetical protein